MVDGCYLSQQFLIAIDCGANEPLASRSVLLPHQIIHKGKLP